MKIIISLLLIVSASFVNAITVMEINTEFLWDHKSPHEGRIKKASNAPTQKEYEGELNYYAKLIKEQGAQVVGLIEIEGCHVAKALAKKLSGKWKSICKKGRDSYTGQDVALITTFQVLNSSINNHESSYSKMTWGMKVGKRVRPSKVLSAVLVDSKGRKVLVTVAHLISRKRDNNAKREAQATAIRNTVGGMLLKNEFSYEILMGDINDYSSSDTVKILKGGKLKNYSNLSHCSHTYKGRCKLIDHILISDSLKSAIFNVIDMPKRYSDHSAVVLKY